MVANIVHVEIVNGFELIILKMNQEQHTQKRNSWRKKIEQKKLEPRMSDASELLLNAYKKTQNRKYWRDDELLKKLLLK